MKIYLEMWQHWWTASCFFLVMWPRHVILKYGNLLVDGFEARGNWFLANFILLSADSCAEVKCGEGKQCVMRKGRPKCVCAPDCRGAKSGKGGGPVCGTDGRSYRSACRLMKRACRRGNTSLQVDYRGLCQSKWAERASRPSPTESAFSEMMDAFSHATPIHYSQPKPFFHIQCWSLSRFVRFRALWFRASLRAGPKREPALRALPFQHGAALRHVGRPGPRGLRHRRPHLPQRVPPARGGLPPGESDPRGIPRALLRWDKLYMH